MFRQQFQTDGGMQIVFRLRIRKVFETASVYCSRQWGEFGAEDCTTFDHCFDFGPEGYPIFGDRKTLAQKGIRYTTAENELA